MDTTIEEVTDLVTTTTPVLLLTQAEAEKISALLGEPVSSVMFNGKDFKVVIV